MLDVVRLINVVRIQEEHDVARRSRKACVEARQLPLIRLGDDLDPRILAVLRAEQFAGTVGRAVVDDDDLVERDRLPQGDLLFLWMRTMFMSRITSSKRLKSIGVIQTSTLFFAVIAGLVSAIAYTCISARSRPAAIP